MSFFFFQKPIVTFTDGHARIIQSFGMKSGNLQM